MSHDPQSLSWFDELGRLRLAGYLEGTTLILLLLVAVPLKHLAGVDGFVTLMGPVHGGSFVLYFVCAVNVVAAQSFKPMETARIVIAALLPFGTFINDRFLARKHREVRS